MSNNSFGLGYVILFIAILLYALTYFTSKYMKSYLFNKINDGINFRVWNVNKKYNTIIIIASNGLSYKLEISPQEADGLKSGDIVSVKQNPFSLSSVNLVKQVSNNDYLMIITNKSNGKFYLENEFKKTVLTPDEAFYNAKIEGDYVMVNIEEEKVYNL